MVFGLYGQGVGGTSRSPVCMEGIHSNSSQAFISHVTRRTADHQDTLRALAGLHRHINALHVDLSGEGQQDRLLCTWRQFRANRQEAGSKSMALRDVWSLMLASIKGAGHGAVSALCHSFSTPASMHAAVRARQAIKNEEALQLLMGLNPAGGGRAVGRVLASHLLEVLFPSSEQ